MIKFTDKDHKYTNNDIKYTSVSQIIEHYTQPFNEEYWSKYKAIEAIVPSFFFTSLKKIYGYKKVANQDHEFSSFATPGQIKQKQEEIKEIWKEKNKISLINGTKFHLENETISYKKGYEINPYTNKKYNTFEKKIIEGQNQSLTTNLYDLEDGFYPELLVWNDKYKIAGQADKVFIHSTKKFRCIDIDDYKTNIEIKISNRFQKMKSPLNHLDDCNYNHYRLQMSTYAWLLEQFGFKVRNIGFTHYLDYDINNPKPYKIKYAKKEVSDMIKHFSKKH